MSADEKMDCGRRRLLLWTAGAGGAATAAAVVPFAVSLTPSERAKSAGAPVEVDISKLAPGQMMTVEWRGKPVWIINRTKDMLDSLKKTDDLVSDPKSDKPGGPVGAAGGPERRRAGRRRRRAGRGRGHGAGDMDALRGSQAPAAAPVTAPPGEDPEARLAKLKSLLDKGLVTQADYDSAKAEILKKLIG